MANRTIEQKKVKMRRRGRFRNTGASTEGKQFINTGQGPKIGSVAALYGNNTGNRLVRNNKTGQISVIGVSPEREAYLRSRFPGKQYTNKALSDRNEITNVMIALSKDDILKVDELQWSIIPIVEVHDLLDKLKEQMKQDIKGNFFRYRNLPGLNTIDLFFSPKKDLWMAVEMKDFAGDRFIRVSLSYPSKSLIIQALELSMVRWVETVPLPDSPSPLL